MKRLLVLILAVIVASAFAACGSGEPPSNSAAEEDATEAAAVYNGSDEETKEAEEQDISLEEIVLNKSDYDYTGWEDKNFLAMSYKVPKSWGLPDEDIDDGIRYNYNISDPISDTVQMLWSEALYEEGNAYYNKMDAVAKSGSDDINNILGDDISHETIIKGSWNNGDLSGHVIGFVTGGTVDNGSERNGQYFATKRVVFAFTYEGEICYIIFIDNAIARITDKTIPAEWKQFIASITSNKIASIRAEYDGSGAPGELIDNESSDISVYAVYSDGSEEEIEGYLDTDDYLDEEELDEDEIEGYFDTDDASGVDCWTITNPSELVAGKTKEYVVEYKGFTTKLKIAGIEQYGGGTYKIGKEMPAGEYLIEGSGYLALSRDSKGTLDSIITNDNYKNRTYIKVKKGEYLEFDGTAFPSKNAPKYDSKTYKEGMYKVGKDIPAGEYKVKADGDAYVEVSTDCRGSIYSIVMNDNFSGSKYVTVSNGQFLKLNSCKIKLK